MPDIKKAVITVPALFAEKARVATLDAAKMAGMKLIELINEQLQLLVIMQVFHQ